MPDPHTPQTSPGRPASGAVPPPIRLVHAFAEAVDASPPSRDVADEAYLVESLLIAATCSFDALSRFASLWHSAAFGDAPSAEDDEQAVAEGYDAWLEGAQPLFERLHRLERASYETSLFTRFESDYGAARSAQRDVRHRRDVEKTALSSKQLAALVAKLKSRDTPE